MLRQLLLRYRSSRYLFTFLLGVLSLAFTVVVWRAQAEYHPAFWLPSVIAGRAAKVPVAHPKAALAANVAAQMVTKTTDGALTPPLFDSAQPINLSGPLLGSYASANVPLSGNTTVAPDAPPTDTTYTTATTSAKFKGSLAVNPSTGVVRVTNASPTGVFPVTVKSFGAGGTQTATFNLTVTSGTVCGGQPGFTSAANISTSNASYAAAVADFNNDGKQDVAIADSQNLVAIRLGNGNGTFTNMPNVTVAASPIAVIAIAVGDFNGDGNQDFATANNQGGSISVRLGNGAGGFTSMPDLSFSDSPLAIATGDFNGDGITDIVATKVSSPRAAIFLGNGLGGFTFSSEIAVGTYPQAVVVGDFNSDGKLDVATANRFGSSVSIRFGDGNGNLSGTTNISVATFPYSVAVGDFNSDGKLDLVTANNATSNSAILMGDGAGNFTSPTYVSVGTGPWGVAVGDFNADGKDDFVVIKSTGSAALRLGDGAGNFIALTDTNAGTMPEGLAIGDFNGDGRQDLIFANYVVPSYSSVRLGGCLRVSTTTTVASSANPSVLGQSVTLTATITPNPNIGTPTGTVQFFDGASPITSCGGVPFSGGQAQCTISALSVSSHTISASYSGDSNFNTSTGSLNTNPQVVNKAETTVTLTNATSLMSTATGQNQSYTVNWNVTVNAPGSSVAALTGNVTVSDGTDSCRSAVSTGTCNLTSTTAGAKTITVSYEGDNNFTPSNNATTHQVNPACVTNPIVTNNSDSGAGSLREALAIACPGSTITFASGVSSVTLTSGELVINKNLTIQGPGANLLTIQRSTAQGTPDFRIFNISSGVACTLDKLTIANGRINNTANGTNLGGGIFNSGGTLTITNSTLSNNSVSGSLSDTLITVNNLGGGIYNSSGGTLVIANSTLSDNSASGSGSFCEGGGIFGNSGTLTITDTTLSNNSANGSLNNLGGSLLCNTPCKLTLTGSRLSNNSVSGGSDSNNIGGGIFNSGVMHVANTTLATNMASGGRSTLGGGIHNSSVGTLTLLNSTLSGNSASGSSDNSSGGGLSNVGPLTIINSTFSNNSASGSSRSLGGGINSASGPLTLINSTLFGNSVSGGSSFNRGGGIYRGSGTVNARNTLIAGNTSSADGPDVFGLFASQGYNLIGKGDDSSGFTNASNGDQVGTINAPLNPRLGPLANNGGPTQTHALLPDSPAINAGSAITTLSGTINDTVNTLTLADATAFPAGVGFVIQLDNEQMLVTDKTGNTLTVTRGVNNTAPAQHSDGTAVNPAFDQRGTGFNRQFGAQPDVGAVEAKFALAVTRGNNQSTIVATAFAQPLQATLTDAGQPVSGVPLTFTVPTNGASATLNGLNPATTDSTGRAGINATANNLPGAYAVIVSLGNLSQSFNLTNTCPVITINKPTTTTGTAGTFFSQPFTQSGGVGNVVFTTTSLLPMGLTLAANGTLSGTPTQIGTFPIVVRATDANNCFGESSTYMMVIGCPTITVNNPTTNTGALGVFFSQAFTQTGGIGNVSFSTTSPLPTGLSLASDGTLSGTPSQTGSFPIIVTATDGNNCPGQGAIYNLVISCLSNPVVTNGNDSGVGSLREAVAQSCPGSIITFASGVSSVTLTSSELVINKNLTIQGLGAQLLSVQRASNAGKFRLFSITANMTVNLSKLTISGGRTADAPVTPNVENAGNGGDGGGLYNAGRLTLNAVAIIGNVTGSGSSVASGYGGSGGSGGGIYNAGTLTLLNSTVSGNATGGAPLSAGSGGGPGGNGGGIYSSGTVTIVNSTISGNTTGNGGGHDLSPGAGGSGGGIYSSGLLTAFNSTISRNATGSGGTNTTYRPNGAGGNGGGVRNANSAANSVKLSNTLVALNTTAGTNPDLSGTFTSLRHNLIGKNEGAESSFPAGNPNANNDQVGTLANPLDPLLGPLADNGGPTQTMALLANSPALNAGGDVTTLSGAISFNATSLTLQNAAAFPVSAVLQIDSEQLTVTAVSSNTLTVSRGSNNTAAAGHNDGAAVNPAFDQRGLGFPRQVGSAPDIGAFEVQNNAPTLTLNTTAPSLSQGSQQSGVALGSVNDVETAVGGLQVSVTSANPSNSVTLSQFSNANGLLSATLQADCLATNASFTLAVRDEAGAVTTAQLNVSVTPNTGPVVNYPNNPGTVFGTGLTINPLDPPTDNGAIQSFQVASIVPALSNGISVNSAGVVTVANTVPANSYQVTIRATDNCNLTQEAKFTLGIAKFAPTVTWNNPADIAYGTALSATQLNASANVPGSFSYTPAPGSVLSAGNGQTLAVTFTPADTTNYSTVTKQVALNVLKGALAVTVNNAYRNQGEANPAFSGTLTGLKNNDAITASYSTTANSGSVPGSYPITATLNDPTNRLGNYTVTNTPGTLTILNSCGITLNPVTLPAATLGTPYVQTLSAAPTGSYSFSLLDGTLPPGLSLVNTLGVYSVRGTTPTPGNYQFTLKAKKNNSTCEAVRTYTMVVQ